MEQDEAGVIYIISPEYYNMYGNSAYWKTLDSVVLEISVILYQFKEELIYIKINNIIYKEYTEEFKIEFDKILQWNILKGNV